MTSVVSRFPLARVTCEIPTYNEQGGLLDAMSVNELEGNHFQRLI